MEGDKLQLWYSFEAEKEGAVGEFIELPVVARTPQGAGEILSMLLENRPDQTTEYRVKVRQWL